MIGQFNRGHCRATWGFDRSCPKVAWLFLLTAAVHVCCGRTVSSSQFLRVGVVQMALEASLAENRDKIIGFIRKAKSEGCRLAVFPEASLTGPPETEVSEISSAVSSIKKAADELDLYIMFGCAK